MATDRVSKLGLGRLLLAGGAAITLATGQADAQAAAPAQVDISEQSLAGALNQVGRQTGTEIIFAPSVAQGQRAPALRGEFTVEQALDRLLEGTGLRYRRTAQGAYVVEAAASGEAEAAGAAAESAKIVVTGTRLRRLGAQTARPVTVVDREAIERTGAGNLSNIFRYIPEVSMQSDQSIQFANATTVQLRGLPFGSTLVLINGRRVQTSGALAAGNFFNLNNLPGEMVERVEILASGASAVYGADAIAGVVNVILRKHYQGLQLSGRIGNVTRGGAAEYNATLTAGLERGNFRGLLALDAFHQDSRRGTELPLIADSDQRRNGGSDWRVTGCNPGNVTSNTAANLPGLTTRTAGIPAGSTGVGLTPANFVATAGIVNRCSNGALNEFQPKLTRLGAFGSMEYEISPALTFFAEGLASDMRNERKLAPAARNSLLVPATNPFNPFGVPVRVDYRFDGVGPMATRFKGNFLRGLAGARGSISRNWRWEAGLMRTRDKSRQILLNEINAAALTAALAQTNPALAFNPFQDGPGGSQAVLDSIRTTPSRHFDFKADATQVDGHVTGNLFRFPGGMVQLVVGGEWRAEKMHFGGGVPFDNDRESSSQFGELLVPLVSKEMGVGPIHSLILTGAVRRDHYSDFGTTVNPQFGIEFRPIEPILIRASYGTSFKPPSLFQLGQPRNSFLTTIFDPRRGNVGLTGTVFSGGSSDLDAETGKSTGAGIVFTPTKGSPLQGLSVSLDYYNIKLSGKVQSRDFQSIVGNEALLPGRVVRAAPTPADIAAGQPGQIISVDATFFNFGDIKVSGLDFRSSYPIRTRIGTFTPSVAATYALKYDVAIIPGAPVQNRLGQFDSEGFTTRWKATGSLDWAKGPAQVGIVARYTHSYKGDSFSTQFGVDSTTPVKSSTLFDMYASYNFGEHTGQPLWGTRLSAGMTNIFDTDPPFFDTPSGYDSRQGEIRGRFVYLRLAKKFF